MNARAGILVLLLLPVGCSDAPTDEGPPLYPLAPSWHYRADQPPSALRIEGEVEVTFQTGRRFDAAVSLVETDPLGQFERRTGLLSGRFRDSVNVEFDMRLDTEVRRHIGRFSTNRDTIAGSWVHTGTAVTGTFRMHR